MKKIIETNDQLIKELVEALKNCAKKRIGCIACPMQGGKKQNIELEKYAKFKKLYARAFERMIENRNKKGLKTTWKNSNDVFNWWFKNKEKKTDQLVLFEKIKGKIK